MPNKISVLASVLLLLSCSQNAPDPNGSHDSSGVRVIENVPFVRQKDSFCGPAAMASVMKFHGQDVSQDAIAEEVYTPKLRGALISDMENFANEMGYRAETRTGDLNTLISVIDEGVPAILIVDLGKWVVTVPHYYVVYGYDKSRKNFIMHTGFKSDQKIDFSELDREWRKMDRLMLLLRK
ncbi:MAG: C39 family peptidase [Thermodesulfobacteriota bacterium]